MKEKLTGFTESTKAFFAKMNKKTRIGLGVTLGLIVLSAIVIALVLENKPYTVLFTGLTADESSSIMTYLEENGAVDYRLENNDTILVPKDQEAKLKAKLLMDGYPKSGFAYSTYLDNVSSLATDADRQTAFLFDLQDRMSAVIRCLDGVKNAWVTIAQGEDQRYVLDRNTVVDATASVLVEMQGAQTLTKQQATAIRNLVARGVKGLTIENITISDTVGNTYTGDEGSGVSSDASQLKLQLEEQVNNKVRTNVMQVLTPFFGENNVRVSVNSTVDVSHSVGNSTTYTEPEWAADGSTEGKGIIGSRIYENIITRGGDKAAGGVAGTENNSDLNTYVEDQTNPDGTETSISTSGQVDYNVNTKQEQVERTAGVVSDLSISVSLNSAVTGPVDVANLTAHVARAAGIEAGGETSKISILTLPFYEEETPGILPSTSLLPENAIYIAAIAGGAVFLLLLLLAILGRRKKRKNKKTLQPQPAVYEPVQPVAEGADITNMRSEKSMELRRDVREFANNNPEIAAQMVKGWLKGEEENG